MLVAGLLATHAFLLQVTSSVTSGFHPGFSQIGPLTLFWLCLPLINANLGVAIDSVLVSLDSVVFSLDSSQSSVFMVPARGVDQGGTLKPANYPEGAVLMVRCWVGCLWDWWHWGDLSKEVASSSGSGFGFS